MSDGAHFLLVKRGLYYRPGGHGYTGIKEYAGRFHESDADPECGVTAVHEDKAAEYSSGCFKDVATKHLAMRVRSLSNALVTLLTGGATP